MVLIIPVVQNVVFLVSAISLVCAIDLNVNDISSIRNASSIIAHGLVSYYKGNASGPVGLLPQPYYWWEAGAMWGTLINYWHYTNDMTYNNITTQALLSQVGPANDYVVPAQQFDEGNDDQAFWGFSVLSAVETSFPSISPNTTQWLSLAEALWNTQVARWDLTSCGGGLKWQIYKSNAGYDYKNSISNGGFFQLCARLARYTGNQTYIDWAEKTWNWTQAVGLIDSAFNVYDGTDDKLACLQVDHTLESYNAGVYLYGAAVLYNYTNSSSIWQTRTAGLLNATAAFFSPFSNATNIMFEPTCERDSSCNPDQQSFKAYLARWMWATAQLAPFTHDAIVALLTPSALGAAAACSGGMNGVSCGSRWYTGGFDNVYGVGEQLAALEVIQGLLVNETAAPATGPGVYIAAAPSSTSSSVAPSVVPAQSSSTAIPAPTRKSAAEREFGDGLGVAAGVWIVGTWAVVVLVGFG